MRINPIENKPNNMPKGHIPMEKRAMLPISQIIGINIPQSII